MIKRIILTIALFVAVLSPVVAAQPAFAVDLFGNQGSACNNQNATSKPSFCKDNNSGTNSNPIYGKDGILTSIINILAKVVGLISTIIIIISGIRMIMSQDSGASSNARRGVISALVGLLIALVAQALVSFVLSKL